MTDDAEDLSMSLFAIPTSVYITDIIKYLFKSFAYFLNWVVCFLIIIFWECFVYLGYKSFTRYMIFRYFLLVYNSYFLLIISFKEQGFLI